MGGILYVIYFNGVTAGIKEGYAAKKRKCSADLSVDAV